MAPPHIVLFPKPLLLLSNQLLLPSAGIETASIQEKYREKTTT